MRRLLYFSLITVIAISLTTCSDSGTGADTENNNDRNGDSSETTTYTVDVSATEGGSVSPSGSNEYVEGEEIELQADPSDEYLFDGWTGDVESSDNPFSLTVDQDYELTANFEIKSYELAISKEGEGAVQEEVLEQKSKEYKHGTIVELTANPAEGYKFVEWQGDIEGIDNPAELTIDNPKEVTAVFEKKSYELTVNTEGEGAVSEEVAQSKSYDHGTVVELTANPAEGYTFSEWKEDLTGTNNPEEITIDEPKEVTAVFEKKTYTLSTSTTGEGTLSLDPNQSEYEYGATVDITANAESGWEFVEWADDAEGTENPIEIIMDGPKEIRAIFEKNNFSLHENGVTITCDDAQPGETGEVDGVEYVAVDREMLDEKIENDEDLTTVCTTPITDMEGLFWDADSFNEDIRHWDVSKVTTMKSMFRNLMGVFNRNFNDWDVSNVTNMDYMFRESSYNGNISNWDVSSVTTMVGMFRQASSFKGDLSDWDMSSVTNIKLMFYRASSFNSDISNWDVSNITDMSQLFEGASSFNQDLSGWDVSNVTTMESMFARASDFNGDLSGWDVSNVTNMDEMFSSASDFNTNIMDWDVGNVTQMGAMFYQASSFNQDISGWCVSKISEQPALFSEESPLFDAYHPDWGSCPE